MSNKLKDKKVARSLNKQICLFTSEIEGLNIVHD